MNSQIVCPACKELEQDRRIDELEKRVKELETRPQYYPPVYAPLPSQIPSGAYYTMPPFFTSTAGGNSWFDLNFCWKR